MSTTSSLVAFDQYGAFEITDRDFIDISGTDALSAVSAGANLGCVAVGDINAVCQDGFCVNGVCVQAGCGNNVNCN